MKVNKTISRIISLVLIFNTVLNSFLPVLVYAQYEDSTPEPASNPEPYFPPIDENVPQYQQPPDQGETTYPDYYPEPEPSDQPAAPIPEDSSQPEVAQPSEEPAPYFPPVDENTQYQPASTPEPTSVAQPSEEPAYQPAPQPQFESPSPSEEPQVTPEPASSVPPTIDAERLATAADQPEESPAPNNWWYPTPEPTEIPITDPNTQAAAIADYEASSPIPATNWDFSSPLPDPAYAVATAPENAGGFFSNAWDTVTSLPGNAAATVGGWKDNLFAAKPVPNPDVAVPADAKLNADLATTQAASQKADCSPQLKLFDPLGIFSGCLQQGANSLASLPPEDAKKGLDNLNNFMNNITTLGLYTPVTDSIETSAVKKDAIAARDSLGIPKPPCPDCRQGETAVEGALSLAANLVEYKNSDDYKNLSPEQKAGIDAYEKKLQDLAGKEKTETTAWGNWATVGAYGWYQDNQKSKDSTEELKDLYTQLGLQYRDVGSERLALHPEQFDPLYKVDVSSLPPDKQEIVAKIEAKKKEILGIDTSIGVQTALLGLTIVTAGEGAIAAQAGKAGLKAGVETAVETEVKSLAERGAEAALAAEAKVAGKEAVVVSKEAVEKETAKLALEEVDSVWAGSAETAVECAVANVLGVSTSIYQKFVKGSVLAATSGVKCRAGVRSVGNPNHFADVPVVNKPGPGRAPNGDAATVSSSGNFAVVVDGGSTYEISKYTAGYASPEVASTAANREIAKVMTNAPIENVPVTKDANGILKSPIEGLFQEAWDNGVKGIRNDVRSLESQGQQVYENPYATVSATHIYTGPDGKTYLTYMKAGDGDIIAVTKNGGAHPIGANEGVGNLVTNVIDAEGNGTPQIRTIELPDDVTHVVVRSDAFKHADPNGQGIVPILNRAKTPQEAADNAVQGLIDLEGSRRDDISVGVIEINGGGKKAEGIITTAGSSVSNAVPIVAAGGVGAVLAGGLWVSAKPASVPSTVVVPTQTTTSPATAAIPTATKQPASPTKKPTEVNFTVTSDGTTIDNNTGRVVTGSPTTGNVGIGQPTATAVPPTATAVPPTQTAVPPAAPIVAFQTIDPCLVDNLGPGCGTNSPAAPAPVQPGNVPVRTTCPQGYHEVANECYDNNNGRLLGQPAPVVTGNEKETRQPSAKPGNLPDDVVPTNPPDTLLNPKYRKDCDTHLGFNVWVELWRVGGQPKTKAGALTNEWCLPGDINRDSIPVRINQFSYPVCDINTGAEVWMEEWIPYQGDPKKDTYEKVGAKTGKKCVNGVPPSRPLLGLNSSKSTISSLPVTVKEGFSIVKFITDLLFGKDVFAQDLSAGRQGSTPAENIDAYSINRPMTQKDYAVTLAANQAKQDLENGQKLDVRNVQENILSNLAILPIGIKTANGIKVTTGSDGSVSFDAEDDTYQITSVSPVKGADVAYPSKVKVGKGISMVYLALHEGKGEVKKEISEDLVEHLHKNAQFTKVKIAAFYDKNNNNKLDKGENMVPWAGITVSLINTIPEQNISLSTGWNLITLPALPVKPLSASSFIGEVAKQGGYVTTVSALDDGSFKTYIKRGATDYSGDDFPIEPGKAYFVKVLKPVAFEFAGQKFVAPLKYKLTSGWNGVGVPKNDKIDKASKLIDAINQKNGGADAVSRWNYSLWETYVQNNLPARPAGGPAGRQGQKYGRDFLIGNNKGYLIRLKSQGEFEL